MPIVRGKVTVLAQAKNPFSRPIPKGSMIADFATIPDCMPGEKARVNQLEIAPGGRLFAVDQRGPIYFISPDGKSGAPFLDLRDYQGLQLTDTSEAGFQSMAFHPEFEEKDRPGFGKFYTLFSSRSKTREPDFFPRDGEAFDSSASRVEDAGLHGRPFRPRR